MVEAFERVVSTKEDAHAAAVAAYAQAQLMLADGARVKIIAAVDHDDLSVRQRRFLHGPVLGQIAEQVALEGKRYARPIWKEFFRRELLGDRWEIVRVQGAEPKPARIRVSTEDLNVKQYSDYLDRVIAMAATDFGVAFRFDIDEREAARWKQKARAAA